MAGTGMKTEQLTIWESHVKENNGSKRKRGGGDPERCRINKTQSQPGCSDPIRPCHHHQ